MPSDFSFVKSGNKYSVVAKETLNLCDRLPAATYSLGLDCTGQYFVQTIDPFRVKGKIYGDTVKQSDRILQTFSDREASTGVLLVGEKGSGKTLLAKYISAEAAKQDIPTIVVNSNEYGEKFNKFLQAIRQPCVILFDEFEKVYSDNQEQEEMLTLLDGVYPSKKLFLLTCNDRWRINSHMRNRPGRIYYLINFTGLGQSFIEEYCQDNLEQKEHIEKVCAIAQIFSAFNFDMLKGLVEEMNRYKETPQDAMKFLNTRPEFNDSKRYTFKLYEGEELIPETSVGTEWSGNPLFDKIGMSYYSKAEDYKKRITQEFQPSDLCKLERDSGKLYFVNKKNAKLVLTEEKTRFVVNFDKLTSKSAAGAVSKVVDADDDNAAFILSQPEQGDYESPH